jgi:ABC-type branched-subunit amino acid transport system substrate-binding protein
VRARTLVALALAISACTAPGPSITPTPAPTREPGALNVTALLDLSASRGPNGAPQRDALQLWADQHATSSPRVRLKIVDVAGSPAKTVLELRRAAVDDRADAIVVGVPVDYDDAFADAVQLASVPVLFTLPVPDPATSDGGWAFALAPTPAQLARATIDDAARRDSLVVSVVVSDESRVAVTERVALVAELTRRGVTPNVLTVTPADAAQRVRRFYPVAQITFFFAGQPKPYLEAARTAPTGASLYLSYLCDPGEAADLRDAATLASWPGSRWIAAPSTTPSPVRAAFVEAFTDRAGPPTTHAASAYDALGLLAAAASGGVEPARLRDRLQAAPFAGVATTYSFSASRRAGFALDDLVFLRYAGARAAPAVR